MRWGKAAMVEDATFGATTRHRAVGAQLHGPSENTLGGEEDEIMWRGHRVAFSRHGSGSPVLLVHGIRPGASSLEWRHIVPALAERHTVIALDLLGFGRSDRPSLRYTPGMYQALLGEVVARVIREPSTVVASSLSAAFLVALAARDPRLLAALVLIAPTGVSQHREPEAGGAARVLLRTPVVGNRIYNGLTSPASMRRHLEAAYADDRLVTPALVEQHVRAAQQPGGKHAVAAYLSGKLALDVRSALRRVRQPGLLLWGNLARENPVENAHAFRVLKRDLEWTLVQEAGDRPHEERPSEVNAALCSFIERARRLSPASGPRLVMA